MATEAATLITPRFTLKIICAMLLAVAVGLLLRWLPIADSVREFLADGVFYTLGQVFLRLLQLLVVPVVFVSIVCGTASLGGGKALARISIKTVSLYLLTTVIAISFALFLASLLHIGAGFSLAHTATYQVKTPSSLPNLLVSLFPVNPFKSLAEGNLLQVILFALLFGLALSVSKTKAKPLIDFFNSANTVIIKLVLLIMRVAPYGVFCLLAQLLIKVGFAAIWQLMGYFFAVLLCLMLQLFVVYSVLLVSLAKRSPCAFFENFYSVMLFAFSVSSSNACIPITMQAVKNRLQVKPEIAEFVIPVGATINMDGTAIMQGVATVFIANAYAIHLTLMQFITVIVMATLSSIGTAGVPSVGLITLAMVLQQVGLPVDGIALIIGIDRLLDMVRTAVNVSGDAVVACIVNRFEK